MLYLDQWINTKIGIKKEPLTKEALFAYQLIKIRETIAWAKENSRFYRESLKKVDPQSICSFRDFEEVPFTGEAELMEKGKEMLCVRQDEISRIVTLHTSGTTGDPKRIYFTEEDQELTVDFFCNGMRYMAGPGDAALILLPCQRPGSVGDLLSRGLERRGVKPIRFGPIKELAPALFAILNEPVRTVIGAPVQVLGLAYAWETHVKKNSCGTDIPQPPRDVLLSTDYIPDSLKEQLIRLWGCRVFEHYGMTEMGLGGAVSCDCLQGCHPREGDLFFEVVDLQRGKPVPDGEYGEIVFTTLTRKGMPLIRYKTGDRGRFLPGACPCGSILRRLDKVGHRWKEEVAVAGKTETMAALDELIFSIDGVIDSRPYVIIQDNKLILRVKLFFSGQDTSLPGEFSKRKIK